jgi:hypothetical protein
MKKSIYLVFFLVVNSSLFGQAYYIKTEDKIVEFEYYFKIMDSLVTNNRNDTLFTCRNCIILLEAETKIYASGKLTYFGVFDFSKNDLKIGGNGGIRIGKDT